MLPSVTYKKDRDMNNKLFSFFIIALLITGCGSSTPKLFVGKELYADMKPLSTYVWVGKGLAYSYNNGKWIRSESNDYDFSVVQRRFKGHWHSVKNQLRHHPEYDKAAGPRKQTHIFRVDYEKDSSSDLHFKLDSTFGSGEGIIDRRFIYGQMIFQAKNVSIFAPYSHFRINQSYDYKNGSLIETVLLYKNVDGKEVPFVKIEESAKLAVLN